MSNELSLSSSRSLTSSENSSSISSSSENSSSGSLSNEKKIRNKKNYRKNVVNVNTEYVKNFLSRSKSSIIPKPFQTTQLERVNLDERGSVKSIKRRIIFNRKFNHKQLFNYLRINECVSLKRIYLLNPGIRQSFATIRQIRYNLDENTNLIPFQEEDSFINENSLKIHYISRSEEYKITDHWGQRKLFINELYFLTNFSEENSVVFYVGAAPGNHTNYLSELFPDIIFYLFDGANFETIPEENKIIINNNFFDNDNAKQVRELIDEKYSDRFIIFISDIRSLEAASKNISKLEKDEKVLKDMEIQREWVNIIRPNVCMLKFVLPYSTENYKEVEYLDGNLYFQPWQGATSSESRLIINNIPKDGPLQIRKYNIEDYESYLFAYNTVIRTTYFKVEDKYLKSGISYDHCGDCAYEIYVILNYIKKIMNSDSIDDFREIANKISYHCSSNKNDIRKLVLDNDIYFDSEYRKWAEFKESDLRTDIFECNNKIKHFYYIKYIIDN